MSDDRRSGHWEDAITNAITVAIGVPLVAGVVGGAGMAVAFVLGLPFYLFFQQGPEDFMADHPVIFMMLWLAGMIIVAKGFFFAGVPIRISSDVSQVLLGGLLLIVASFVLVLVIAGGLAFLAHLDVSWAKDAIER